MEHFPPPELQDLSQMMSAGSTVLRNNKVVNLSCLITWFGQENRGGVLESQGTKTDGTLRLGSDFQSWCDSCTLELLQTRVDGALQ